MSSDNVLYLMKQDKETLSKRWLPNYKLMFQLFSSIQKYFSTILNIPQNKIINQGYQEFFTKYFFNLDRYRKFLEKVKPPYIIYNIQNYELDRSKLNKLWNDDGLQAMELNKYFLYIQKSFMTQSLNVSLYLENREQLLQYLSYLMGTFDLPNGSLLVEYDLTEFIPEDEPLLKGNNLVFTDYIALINPTSFEDSSEYLFDEQLRTFKLSFSFTLEGYVLTKIRFYSKTEEGISTFIINSPNVIQANSTEYSKVNKEEEYNLSVEQSDTQVNLNLIEVQKDNITSENKDDLDIMYYEIIITTPNNEYTITPSMLQNTNETQIIETKTVNISVEYIEPTNSTEEDIVVNISPLINTNDNNQYELGVIYDNNTITYPIDNETSENNISLSSIIENQLNISEQVNLNLLESVTIKNTYNDNLLDEETLITKNEENGTLIINDSPEIQIVQNIIKVEVDDNHNVNIESNETINVKIDYIVSNKYTVYTTTNLDTGETQEHIPSGELEIRLIITKDENGKPISQLLPD